MRKKLLVMLVASLVAFLAFALVAFRKPAGDVYGAWTDTGMHLMLCDNGTPDDPEDDYICDWEDNRIFAVFVGD